MLTFVKSGANMNGMKAPHPILLVVAVVTTAIVSVIFTAEMRYTITGFVFGVLMAPLVGWFAYAKGMEQAIGFLQSHQDTLRRSIVLERSRPLMSMPSANPVQARPVQAMPNYMAPASEIRQLPANIPVSNVADREDDAPLIVG